MNKVNKFVSIVILKEHSPDMDNPIASVDAVELIDSNIIDASKQSDVAIKKDVMETQSELFM